MTTPHGIDGLDGIFHRRSPLAVAETVERLIEEVNQAGAKFFVVVDHSGEAESVGLSLRETKLLVFGNPVAGTPLMQMAPSAALDLPLKVLVWADDDETVWMSYLSGEWLAARHHIPAEIAQPLSAVDILTSRIASSG